ncbi:expressed unknown protein [Seminavis robusta]|uniref:Uncharacterized protein n=1 Tax=Seminavis robusta TaxID=568900 RepID=A0A9N8HP81_9STRA|nr:expressed unknown protein [Seminavis robusta]|eukprot:Sro880_g215070.1 n/a (170) ;mRNA; r:27836-28345
MHVQGMLFPPLVEGDEQQTLPKDIKDRFSKVRSLLREKASSEDEAESSELKRKQEAAALEAARAVQEEMARLQNGIAELEALCALQQQQQQRLQQQPIPEQQSHGDEEESYDSDEEDDGFGWGEPNVVPLVVNAVVEPEDRDRSTGSRSNMDSLLPESDRAVTTQDVFG